MLTKEQKIKAVEGLSKILQDSPNFIFADFGGLKMGEILSLKKDLKRKGIGFKALKKSLIGFAFKKSGKDLFDFSPHKGSVAIVYDSPKRGGGAEPNEIAKLVYDFSSRLNKLAILGGFLMGEKMPKEKIEALARIPSREILLSQVLRLLMSPVSGLVGVLDAIGKR